MDENQKKVFELGPKLTSKVASFGDYRMVTMLNRAPISHGDIDLWVQTLVTRLGDGGALEIVAQIPHPTIPAGYAFQDKLIEMLAHASELGSEIGVASLQDTIRQYDEHVKYLNQQVADKIEYNNSLEKLARLANEENMDLNKKIIALEDEIHALKNPPVKKKRGLGKQK